MAKNYTIRKDDEVTIIAPGHVTVTGTALSVDTGDHGGWMLEIQSPQHGYVYWKEDSDGGYVTHVNGNRIN